MTIVVGVLCKDGVVIGADSSATFAAGQLRTVEQETKKIDIIADKIIVAGTGQIGLGQRFCFQVEQAWSNGNLRARHRSRWQLKCASLEYKILLLLTSIKAIRSARGFPRRAQDKPL